MAGMFYSLKEAAEKLKKTEQDVQNLVKEGRLREFRDGSNLMFKVDDINSMAAEIEGASPEAPKAAPAADQDEIFLAPEAGEEINLSEGDTAIPGKTDILGKTDKMIQPSDDLMGETNVTSVPDKSSLTGSGSGEASLEEIEGDVNLDSFGSGSGLLDLSLQADDTSLGGILDEIYTADGGGESQKAAPEAAGSAADVVAEADQMLAEEDSAPQLVMPTVIQSYAEPASDAVSNAMGIMMFLPLAAILYAIIVSLAGFGDPVPLVVKISRGIVWYLMLGLVVASAVIVGGALVAGGGGTKKSKAPKIKKEKPPKKNKKAAEAPAKPA